MIRGVLLDFYGTLVGEDDRVVTDICERVRATTAEPERLTAREIGYHWWRVFRGEKAFSVGPAFRSQRQVSVSSLTRTLRHFGSPAVAATLCEPLFTYWRQPYLSDDAHDFLAGLRMPACVVSNIDREDLQAALDYHRLPVGLIVTSQDARCYKPHSAMFQAALGLLGLRNDEVLHVGDSLSGDVDGAYAMGIPAIWLNRTGKYRPEQLTAFSEVDNLHDVLAIIRSNR